MQKITSDKQAEMLIKRISALESICNGVDINDDNIQSRVHSIEERCKKIGGVNNLVVLNESPGSSLDPSQQNGDETIGKSRVKEDKLTLDPNLKSHIVLSSTQQVEELVARLQTLACLSDLKVLRPIKPMDIERMLKIINHLSVLEKSIQNLELRTCILIDKRNNYINECSRFYEHIYERMPKLNRPSSFKR